MTKIRSLYHTPEGERGIVYRELQGYKYDLDKPKTVTVNLPDCKGNPFIDIIDGKLHFAIRYAWDGASGPTWDDKTNMRGTLVHDGIYQLMREGFLNRFYRKYADQLLRDMCIEDAIFFIRNSETPITIKNKYLRAIAKTIQKESTKAKIASAKARYNTWYWAVRMFGGKSAMPRKNPRGKIIEI